MKKAVVPPQLVEDVLAGHVGVGRRGEEGEQFRFPMGKEATEQSSTVDSQPSEVVCAAQEDATQPYEINVTNPTDTLIVLEAMTET